MVSSELVVLLIVFVGINTGSAQGELANNMHTQIKILMQETCKGMKIHNNVLSLCTISQNYVKMKMKGSAILTVLLMQASSVCPLH